MNNLTFSQFNKHNIITSFRDGGVSKGKYASLNLCYLVKDKKENVNKNRDLFYKSINLNPEKLIIVSPETCPLYPIIYTRDKSISIGVLHSDTIPLFFESKNKDIFGAMQITTFGTINHYAYLALKDLFIKEKLNPKDILFYIAPSLTFSHNIISVRKAKALYKKGLKDGIKRTDKTYFLDERFLLIKELRTLKVPFANIMQNDLCTYENDELFFSKKRKTPTGKMMSVIIHK